MKNCATRPDISHVQNDTERPISNILLSTMDYLRKTTTCLSEIRASSQRETSNLPKEYTHQLSGSRYASLKPRSSRCSPVVWHDIETLRISHRAYNSICVVESSEPIPGEHQRRCLRGTQGHKGELPSYPFHPAADITRHTAASGYHCLSQRKKINKKIFQNLS